jgi:membrane protein DedA with SNARE-associated domain
VDANTQIPLEPNDGQLVQPPVAAAPEPSPVWLLGMATALVVVTMLGTALSPYLAVHHPLWLLALNPWPRHQLLVAPHTPAIPFIAIASLRGLLSCAVFYELGRHYGVRTITFLESRSPQSGRFLRAAEEAFEKFSLLLLVAAPGVLTSALAGMSGVSRLSAWLLSWFGLVIWAIANHRLGGFLAPWTAPVLAFLRDNMLLATALCTLLVVGYHVSTRRKSRAATGDVAASGEAVPGPSSPDGSGGSEH